MPIQGLNWFPICLIAVGHTDDLSANVLWSLVSPYNFYLNPRSETAGQLQVASTFLREANEFIRHSNLKRNALISLVFLVLMLLSLWLIAYNWHHRSMFRKDYTFTTETAKKFKHFAQFLYAYGLDAWFGNDSVLAARFFRKAVLQDVLYIDAWIKLAQAELILGNPDKAK